MPYHGDINQWINESITKDHSLLQPSQNTPRCKFRCSAATHGARCSFYQPCWPLLPWSLSVGLAVPGWVSDWVVVTERKREPSAIRSKWNFKFSVFIQSSKFSSNCSPNCCHHHRMLWIFGLWNKNGGPLDESCRQSCSLAPTQLSLVSSPAD